MRAWCQSRLPSRSPALLFDPDEVEGRGEASRDDPRVCSGVGEWNSCMRKHEAREERGERRSQGEREGLIACGGCSVYNECSEVQTTSLAAVVGVNRRERHEEC